MAQNTPFRWTEKAERAAVLLAEDDKTDEAISAELGIGRRTLTRWKTDPEFAQRLKDNIDAYASRILQQGIARREKRIRALDERSKLLWRVIDARALKNVEPTEGTDTGIVVHQVKQVGAGPSAQTIDEYAVDTGLLKELREHEKQAAQEVGQWLEKTEHSGEVTLRRYIGVNPDDV